MMQGSATHQNAQKMLADRFQHHLTDALRGCHHHDVLVSAVSGGPDSMALAHALQHYAQRNGLKHLAVIINHGIRAEASDEAGAVLQMLAQSGVEAQILKVTAPAPTSGIQAWAREQRYHLLLDFCRTHQADLLLAHHADDQAETVLMRLSKASGGDGLGGMRTHAMMRDIQIVRPFLHLHKSDMLAYCDAFVLDYVQDRSNTDMQFERVRMRDFLSDPAQVSLTNYGLRLAAVMQRLSAHYHQQLGRWLAEHALIEPGLQAVLDRQAFDILAPDARHYLIRQLIKTVSGNSYHPRFSQIETLLTGLMQNKTLTCGGCVIQPAPSGYLIQAEWGRRAPESICVAAHQLICFDGKWHAISRCAGQIMRYGQMAEIDKAAYRALKPALISWPARVREMIPCLLGLDGKPIAPHFSRNGKQAGRTDAQVTDILAVWPAEISPLIQAADAHRSARMNEGK